MNPVHALFKLHFNHSSYLGLSHLSDPSLQISDRNFVCISHVPTRATGPGHLILELITLYLNVKLSLCSTRYHAVKTYWGVEAYLHASLNPALEGGDLSASRASRFTPEDTNWVGGGCAQEPVQTRWRREENTSRCRGLNPDRPAHSLVIILTKLPQLVNSILVKAISH
jgi:hypothetical protein